MPVTEDHELNKSNVSGGGDVLGPVSPHKLSREQLDQLHATDNRGFQGQPVRTSSQEHLGQQAPGGPLPPRQQVPMAYQPRTRSQEQLANLPQGSNIAFVPDHSRATNSFV